MGLFSFGKKGSESVVLIDIGATSVGGAYAHFVAGEQPTIYYTARLPVVCRESEELLPAVLRTLDELGTLLIRDGAPLLRQEIGSAHIGRIEVSIGSPWQETEVNVKSMQRDRPFLFTHEFLTATSEEEKAIPEGRIRSGRSVVATIVNGYETANPFGKRVKRADLVVLSSTLDTAAAEGIEQALRRMFHTHAISLIAFAPVAYAVFRDVFPHQKDFIVLDISGMATDAAFVKRGLLMGVSTLKHGLVDLLSSLDKREVVGKLGTGIVDSARNARFAAHVSQTRTLWLEGLTRIFGEFAARQPLPRTLFLLADPFARDFLKQLLDTPSLRSLWLSDEPLGVVPIAPQHFAPYVKSRGAAEGDLYLAMLALYHGKQVSLVDKGPI